MDISVIIPSFNNAAMLKTTLSAFERVSIPEKTEIIVVDNNSTDDTPEAVKAFLGRLPIRYVFEPKRGVAVAKNTGIRASRGDLLIFTDDDVRPCAGWLLTYLSAYKENPKGLFWGGPVVSEFEGPVPEEGLLRVSPPSVRGLDYGVKTRFMEKNEWFVGANMALTAKAAAEVGGFITTLGLGSIANIVLGGEETELQRRLKLIGYRGSYLPLSSIRHVVPVLKCTLKHVAVRAEAGGRYEREISPTEGGKRALRGVPLWRYRRCGEKWLQAWVKRITGRDWYFDYISYRADKGFLLGIPKRPEGE